MKIVIDGNSLVRSRIMASYKDDLSAGGVFTGGVYNTLRSLRVIFTNPEISASWIHAFWDAGVPPRRLELIPTYKQARSEAKLNLSDEEKERLFGQVDLAREMFDLLGIKSYKYKDREADDGVIAAVRILSKYKERVCVVTGDRDLYQAVAFGGCVWDLNTETLIEYENFEEATGVTPETFILYRTLAGDSSDQIGGATGCGKKRAVELVQSYLDELHYMDPMSQLDALVSSLEEVPEKKRRKFEQAIIDEQVRLRNEMQGIDLTRSFGGTKSLRKKLLEPPALDKRGFLRFCKRLEFESVLSQPDRYLRPFSDAEKLRKATLSAT